MATIKFVCAWCAAVVRVEGDGCGTDGKEIIAYYVCKACDKKLKEAEKRGECVQSVLF